MESCERSKSRCLHALSMDVDEGSGLLNETYRIKPGNFGHQINSDSDLVCFRF